MDHPKHECLRKPQTLVCGGIRVFDLVYEELSAVLIVAFGGKKTQQETIDEIVKCLPEFQVLIKNLIKRD